MDVFSLLSSRWTPQAVTVMLAGGAALGVIGELVEEYLADGSVSRLLRSRAWLLSARVGWVVLLWVVSRILADVVSGIVPGVGWLASFGLMVPFVVGVGAGYVVTVKVRRRMGA